MWNGNICFFQSLSLVYGKAFILFQLGSVFKVHCKLQGKTVNIFGILGHMLSVTTIQLCCGGTVDSIQRTGLCFNKTLFAKPGSGPQFTDLYYG